MNGVQRSRTAVQLAAIQTNKWQHCRTATSDRLGNGTKFSDGSGTRATQDTRYLSTDAGSVCATPLAGAFDAPDMCSLPLTRLNLGAGGGSVWVQRNRTFPLSYCSTLASADCVRLCSNNTSSRLRRDGVTVCSRATLPNGPFSRVQHTRCDGIFP